jgi:hypothetical protein
LGTAPADRFTLARRTRSSKSYGLSSERSANRPHVYAVDCSFDDHKHRGCEWGRVCRLAGFRIGHRRSCISFEASAPHATGITAELPDLDEKDVSLEIANGVLSISGEKKSESEDKVRRFSERCYGRFERRIPLEDAEEDKVSAAFKNGVLSITVPKSAETKKVRRITINRND